MNFLAFSEGKRVHSSQHPCYSFTLESTLFLLSNRWNSSYHSWSGSYVIISKTSFSVTLCHNQLPSNWHSHNTLNNSVALALTISKLKYILALHMSIFKTSCYHLETQLNLIHLYKPQQSAHALIHSSHWRNRQNWYY